MSQCDSLWKIFWEARCLFRLQDATKKEKTSEESLIAKLSMEYDKDSHSLTVHGAALVFRHAIVSMNLCPLKKTNQSNNEKANAFKSETDATNQSEHQSGEYSARRCTLFSAYVQTHCMMKLTNLRVFPSSKRNFIFGINTSFSNEKYFLKTCVQLENAELCQQLCTQSWPGRLSDVSQFVNSTVNENRNISITTATFDNFSFSRVIPNSYNNNINNVQCLNPAEVWCDYPGCNQARCGAQGCLRCYRFLPTHGIRDTDDIGGRTLQGECSERNYDLLTFVKCSWCSVSFCNEHVNTYFIERNWCVKHWFQCEDCRLSACPDCVSQVFTTLPYVKGCQVVTCGKMCGRVICKDCAWYVGWRKQSSHDENKESSTNDILHLVSQQGMANRVKEDMGDFEPCCSKCHGKVESRIREMVIVQESFGGFMP